MGIGEGGGDGGWEKEVGMQGGGEEVQSLWRAREGGKVSGAGSEGAGEGKGREGRNGRDGTGVAGRVELQH